MEKILVFVSLYVILQPDFNAQMAELVDASDSKSGIGNNVQVRFLFWALQSFVSFYKAFFVLKGQPPLPFDQSLNKSVTKVCASQTCNINVRGEIDSKV